VVRFQAQFSKTDAEGNRLYHGMGFGPNTQGKKYFNWAIGVALAGRHPEDVIGSTKVNGDVT
jgi:hypothetical protein